MAGSIVCRSHPRVGLLGNPSDLYGGRVVSFLFDRFVTTVELDASESGVTLQGHRWESSGDVRLEDGLEGGASLLAAAWLRWSRGRNLPVSNFQVSFASDVPRQAGLSGSSAIILGAMAAWSRHFDVPCTPFELSELALATENEELGITAGPQDRVIQAFGGVRDMDFTRERAASNYRSLDPGLLPPLLIAWKEEAGEDSGAVHHDVRERWLAGDPEVRAAIARFVPIVERGVAALEAGDHATFAGCMDENFDARASVFPIAGSDRAMVDLGRSAGAGVKFCGSGGAVVAVPRDGDLDRVEAAYQAAGYRTLRPRVATEGVG